MSRSIWWRSRWAESSPRAWHLERPGRVRRLVLTVTSGGVNMTGHGAADWQADYRRSFPRAAGWITEASPSSDLPVERIAAPTLLIWGDYGRHQSGRRGQAPRAAHSRRRACTSSPGGDHDLAKTHADLVARLIARHLTA